LPLCGDLSIEASLPARRLRRRAASSFASSSDALGHTVRAGDLPFGATAFDRGSFGPVVRRGAGEERAFLSR
jgi:hypothetical protein